MDLESAGRFGRFLRVSAVASERCRRSIGQRYALAGRRTATGTPPGGHRRPGGASRQPLPVAGAATPIGR